MPYLFHGVVDGGGGRAVLARREPSQTDHVNGPLSGDAVRRRQHVAVRDERGPAQEFPRPLRYLLRLPLGPGGAATPTAAAAAAVVSTLWGRGINVQGMPRMVLVICLNMMQD